MPRLTARCTTSASPSTVGVEERELAQRVDDRAGDERQRGESGRRSDPFDLPRSRRRRSVSACGAVRFDASSAVAARRRTLLNGTTSSAIGDAPRRPCVDRGAPAPWRSAAPRQ